MNNRHNFDNELAAYLNLFAFERLNVFQFNNEKYQPLITKCADLIDQHIDSSLVMDKDLEDTIATLSKRIGIYYLLCENNRALASKYLTNYRTIHDMKNKLATEQETLFTMKTISKDFIDHEISYAETISLIYYGVCNDAVIHENLLQQLQEHLQRYEELEKSILHVTKRAEIEISKALIYYCIALTAGKANAYEEAHQAIASAIELQTRHAEKNFLVLGDLAESQRLKSILFNNQQQFDDAEIAIKLAIATWANLNRHCSLTHPQLFEAQQTYAMILQSLKRNTEAVNLLNRTLGEQKNFYHTELHPSIVTTQLLLGKILKEDNDLEHAYYELKNALALALQLELPTQMITADIEAILQQKQISQSFTRLSGFPHYAWNQYSTVTAFNASVNAIKPVIDALIHETAYLNPAQQEILNARCVELGNFYCYQHNTSEALKYYRYVEPRAKNFFTSNWVFNHIAHAHLRIIADFSVIISSEVIKKAGAEHYLQCTSELGKSQKCLEALDRASKINHLEEILKLTFYSLYLQALQAYRWGLFNYKNALSPNANIEMKNCLITAAGYLEKALDLYETDDDLANDLTDDNYLLANNLYIGILLELNSPALSTLRDRLKKLEKIWAAPDRKNNPDYSAFKRHCGDYYKKMGRHPSLFQRSSSSNDSNSVFRNRDSELESYIPQMKK